jgi:hypothetical protein
MEMIGKHRRDPTLAFLFDRQFIKDDDSSIWKHDWPPHPGTEVSLLLTFVDPYPPKSLRFWFDTVDSSRSVKEVAVFLDAKQVFRGALEGEFGCVVNLEEESGPEYLPEVKALLEAHNNASKPQPLFDLDGLSVPLLSVSTIEFQILDPLSFGQVFGLSMIRFFNVDGELMRFEPDQVKYEAIDCASSMDIRLLFTRAATKWDEGFVPWSARSLDEFPKIVVTFTEPVKPVAIEIINSDIIHTDEDLRVGDMQISVDNRSVWVGKLKPSQLVSSGTNRNSTIVFLAWTPKISARF